MYFPNLRKQTPGRIRTNVSVEVASGLPSRGVRTAIQTCSSQAELGKLAFRLSQSPCLQRFRSPSFICPGVGTFVRPARGPIMQPEAQLSILGLVWALSAQCNALHRRDTRACPVKQFVDSPLCNPLLQGLWDLRRVELSGLCDPAEMFKYRPRIRHMYRLVQCPKYKNTSSMMLKKSRRLHRNREHCRLSHLCCLAVVSRCRGCCSGRRCQGSL